MTIQNKFRVFDAHLHTYGTFLKKEKDLISYMDKYNVKKALLTTINRYGSAKNLTKSVSEKVLDDNKKLNKILENLRQLSSSKGQLSHEDVIEISKKAPERFYNIFWFNPKIKPEEEEINYKILEDHFKNGFFGVKLHSVFHFVRIPNDIIKLASFMQDFDKNLVLYIHSTPKFSLFKGVSGKDISKLAKTFPNLRIIVGHAAFCMEYGYEVGILLKTYENVFFETSCCPVLGIFNLIKSVGHKRILFGSDAPVTSTIPIELEKILTLPISNEEKQDILYNNINNIIEHN